MKTARLLSFFLIAAAAFLCPGNPEASIVNLLQNGGFESGQTPPTGIFETLSTPSTRIQNWTVNFGSIDWINSYWTAHEGTKSIDLNGTSIGAISQSFATVQNQQYKVNFFMAGNPDKKEEKSILVSAAGINNWFSFTPTPGQSLTNMEWTPLGFSFTANSSITTLLFQSATGSAFGAALDGISVSAVPLPAAAWMLGAGLVGLVALRRRRT